MSLLPNRVRDVFDCNRREFGVSPIAKFIRENFRGARITITLVGSDEEFTGEVVDGFDNVIALKCNGVITFINAFFIATFV